MDFYNAKRHKASIKKCCKAVKKLGKTATRSKHPTIPKEQLIEKFKGAC